jgi:hypothetical protein
VRWAVRGKDAGSVRIRRHTGATEDAASRRPARPGGTGFIAEGAQIIGFLEVVAIVSALVGAGVIGYFFFGRWEE